MTETTPLTDVQFANLTFLLALNRIALQDPADAALRFGIPLSHAKAFAAMTLDEVQRAALSFEDAVAVLRIEPAQLAKLSSVPSPLAALMAAASPPRSVPVVAG